MNDIQDIILESEYSVLMALAEYYEKQTVLESYYNEGETITAPAKPEQQNLIQRFIKWIRNAIEQISAKFNKVPPTTFIPRNSTRQAVELTQLANEYQQAANQPASEQNTQQMNDIAQRAENIQINGTDQSADAANTEQMKVQALQNSLNVMKQEAAKLSQTTSTSNDTTQNNDANTQAKCKAQSSILKKINQLMNHALESVADSLNVNPTTSIEGEPTGINDNWFTLACKRIKSASVSDRLNTYKTYRDRLLYAWKFYDQKLSDKNITPRDKTYCQKRINTMKDWVNQLENLYNHLNNNGSVTNG